MLRRIGRTEHALDQNCRDVVTEVLRPARLGDVAGLWLPLVVACSGDAVPGRLWWVASLAAVWAGRQRPE
jgi:hypothetical protein